MHKAGIWMGAVLTLLAGAALADTLKYANGAEETGTIEEVSFLADDAQGSYARERIASVALGEDGKDILALKDGAKREGKLLSVRFKAGEGLLAVPRKQLQGLELNAAVAIEEKTDTPAESTPAVVLSDEQKEALAKNDQLRKSYLEKAVKEKTDEEKAFADTNKPGWKQAIDEITRLQSSIDAKERARRAAQSDTSSRYTNTGTSTSWRQRQPTNDGLENDLRALEQAKRKLAALEGKLKLDKAKLGDASSEKERAVRRVHGENKADIVAGRVLSGQAMAARYDTALESKAEDTPTKAPKKAGKRPAKGGEGE